LAWEKPLNDRLFDRSIAWFFGLDIGAYRAKHFAHHRLLGEADDPEDQYSAPLSMRRLWDAVATRDSLKRASQQPAEPRNPYQPVSKLFHLMVLAALAVLGGPSVALMAWLVPILVGLPLAVLVRNFCEHHALSNEVPMARNFKAGPMTFFLGAAGFRWHAAHHASPAVRYWMLARTADLEIPADGYMTTLLTLLRRG
jgi:fatty acid desaturase